MIRVAVDKPEARGLYRRIGRTPYDGGHSCIHPAPTMVDQGDDLKVEVGRLGSELQAFGPPADLLPRSVELMK